MIKFFRYYKSIFTLSLILLFLVTINTFINAGDRSIIINEFMFDPIGTDLGYEWIELYNPTDAPINISNWKILVAGTTFKEVSSFSGIVLPHEYFLICETNVQGCNVIVQKLTMQNGGGSTDGIEILNEMGEVVDQVFYDSPNSNGLKNTNGEVVNDSESSEIGNTGETLGRFQFIDTDDSYNDFYIYPTPTPGEENQLIQEELPQTGESPIYLFSFLLILFISGILFYRNNFYKKCNG